MKLFDFNFHLPYAKDEDVNAVIGNDMSLNVEGLLAGLDVHKNVLKKNEGANFMLFNTNLFSEPIIDFSHKVKEYVNRYSITTLLDFRKDNVLEYLDQVKGAGVSALMFNSYLQQISEEDYPAVLQACRYAENNGIMLCFDGSYGTSKMYTYDNLKLICYISDHIKKVPIVIIHSGGMRIKEAMLLALDKTNIWLDTSFSLPYYIGSSLEFDYAFAFKKLSVDKVVFGSDNPYLNSESAVDIHLNFFEKHDFSSRDIDKIMFENAVNLLAL